MKKVLIIDDSPLVLEMAKDMLLDAGFSVHTASNGIEANHHIYSAPDNKPDLIILDIMMPLLSGDKSARILKQADHTKDIPILFVSSKEPDELKRLVNESGVAAGYISKPFTRTSLVGAVTRYI